MHRSRLVMRGANAGAGGMSMNSGSGSGDGASGMGASSSLSVASAMAQSTGSSGAGSGSMCLANNTPATCSPLASSTASWNSASSWARSWRHPRAPGLVLGQDVRDCARCPLGR